MSRKPKGNVAKFIWNDSLKQRKLNPFSNIWRTGRILSRN
jgi:hypothetical protein